MSNETLTPRGCDTDIAVIERRTQYGNEWVAVCYIGPDRSQGQLEDYESITVDLRDLRIRYFDREWP